MAKPNLNQSQHPYVGNVENRLSNELASPVFDEIEVKTTAEIISPSRIGKNNQIMKESQTVDRRAQNNIRNSLKMSQPQSKHVRPGQEQQKANEAQTMMQKSLISDGCDLDSQFLAQTITASEDQFGPARSMKSKSFVKAGTLVESKSFAKLGNPGDRSMMEGNRSSMHFNKGSIPPSPLLQMSTSSALVG